MYGTLPISSATAERSFSTLNHIKTYRRTTMGAERLNGLAKLSIHRELSDDVQSFIASVTNLFALKKKRRKDFIL